MATTTQVERQVSPDLETTFDHAGYFNDDAGLGIFGRGPSPEAACVAAAEALFALIVDPSASQSIGNVSVDIEPGSNSEMLFTWLARLLAEAGRAGAALSSFDLRRQGQGWTGFARLRAKRAGLVRELELGSILPESCSLQFTRQGWEARSVVTVAVRDVLD